MSSLEPNLASEGALALGGWRLHRLEMANWGTFGEGRVHVLAPEGGWSLLIGENGSGKSTAIDALRTLIAPRAILRHSFNDAAGGQKRQDRSLVSYIRGAWSASRDEESTEVSTQFLRKEETPSYLLAVFRNLRSQTMITLAQILWVTNGKDETIYLVAAGEKSIQGEMSSLESGRGLRKELVARGFDVRDSYKAYREDFCVRMGIPGIGALEIFNQAIGVKEVSDVGIFLRRHLLAPSEIDNFIHQRVIPQFQNLESCWNDIGRARAQIELLAPVATAYLQVEEWEAKRGEMQKLQDAHENYYTARHALLLRDYLDHCAEQRQAARSALGELERRIEEGQQKRDSLRLEYDSNDVGRRIREIKLECREVLARSEERRRNYDQLGGILAAESLGEIPKDEPQFMAMRERCAARRDKLEVEQNKANDEANTAGVAKARFEAELKSIKRDLEALLSRRVLVPAPFLDIRDELGHAIGVSVDDLPFAGELMEVKPEFVEDWSGAIERLLHGFGISLLVPERHYQRVASWINGRRLQGRGGEGLRLTFHRVVATRESGANVSADSNTVAGRLNYRAEHPVGHWVESEVRRSFPHVCCRDTQELENERYGITREGLIRGGTRHVKDDRRALGSRRDYVLGWSPEKKVAALERQRDADTEAHAAETAAEKNCRSRAVACGVKRQALNAVLDSLPGFTSIDFSAEQARHDQLASDLSELEKSSDTLQALKSQLDAVEVDLKTMRDTAVTRGGEVTHWSRELEKEGPVVERLEDKVLEHQIDIEELAPGFTEFEANEDINHRTIGEVRERVLGRLRSRSGACTGKIKDAEKLMISPMQKFVERYPEDSTDLRVDPAYATDFVRYYDQLVREDLPRHEERFRDFLNTNLTENIGGLEDKLDTEVKAHRARIDLVNVALSSLEYSPGTFVEIDRRDSRDVTIRDFKARLRDCLGAGLHPDEAQRLDLYKKIREIVVRFSKEPEWTARVTDSRLWLDFGVRERRRENGEQVNYLDSSTGKSGGQKAKLAFTILSASLLAQYGLAEDPHRSDSLRLVVVDEVFARTDESNSRRALELFRRMGFQLLLAAPWKAEARIAEAYVDSFHLTLNPADNASHIQRATRSQYQAHRDQRANAVQLSANGKPR